MLESQSMDDKNLSGYNLVCYQPVYKQPVMVS